jgi:hypothetical protein
MNCLLSSTYSYSNNPQLDDNVFHFDREPEIAAEVQDKIDWDLFKGQGAPPPSLLYPYFLLTKKKIPHPFVASPPISAQCNMRDRNHH